MIGPILRGTALGSVLGILPGRRRDAGVVRRLCAGEEGLAATGRSSARAPSKALPAPEAANNAGAQTSFIPMLTLGIPSNPVMALMIGAMIIQGIQPGPSVMTEQPALFWGIIVSMWIGNLMLLVLNLPLIGLWVRMISVPYHLLYPVILVFCCHRRVQPEQRRLRRLPDGAVRVPRLRLQQARLRAGADAARLHPGSDDGGVPAPRAAALEGRSDRPGHAADQRHDAGRWPLVLLALVLMPAFSKTREVAFQED